MRRGGIRAITLATFAVCALTLGLPGSAAAQVRLSAPLKVDLYSPLFHYYSNPVSTHSKLDHQLYVAVVRGTGSFYQPMDYVAIQSPFIAMCGKPQAAPMFGSAGGAGQVGNDAEFVFAQPVKGKPCSSIKLPRRYTNFQDEVGKSWGAARLIYKTLPTRPSATHTYDFALDGQGRKASFRMKDPDTRDDYGGLRVYIRRAVRSDCAGHGHTAFYLTLKACRQDTIAAAAPSVPKPPHTLTINQAPITMVLRNADLPGAVNGEVPSGALSASQYATVDNKTAAAVKAETKLLQTHSFKSGAITEFHGTGIPSYKSTAALFGTHAEALQALAAELTLAPGTQAPSGTTGGAAQMDTKLPGSYIITFTPGSLELLAVDGNYVLTLVAVGKNPTPVSRTDVESLFASLAGLTPYSAV